MTIFYISIYKGEVIARVDTVDKLIKATMDYTSKLPHAPYPCMVSNDMQASMEYPHINYEEDETNNSKYGFNGSENTY